MMSAAKMVRLVVVQTTMNYQLPTSIWFCIHISYFLLEANFFAEVGVYFQWTRLFRQQYLSALKNIIKNKVLSICSSEEAADFSANIYESTLSEWLKMKLLPFGCTILDAQSARYYE